MRLQNFLLESDGRAKPIGDKDFKQLIETKYKDSVNAYRKDIRYYRGTESSSASTLYIDPKKFIRSSKQNQNYYTLLMSYDPSWSKYPPRDKSVIATTNIGYAQNYGTPYIVLPENGATIGIAPSPDIWSSFRTTLGGSHNLMPLLDHLEDLFLEANFEDAGKDYKTFKEACKKARVNVGELKTYSKVPYSKKDGLYKWLVDVFSPDKNRFKVIKAGDAHQAGTDSEVWTDGECLLCKVTHASEVLL